MFVPSFRLLCYSHAFWILFTADNTIWSVKDKGLKALCVSDLVHVHVMFVAIPDGQVLPLPRHSIPFFWI